MKRPTHPPARPGDGPEVERLIAVCLELYEGEGPRAVEALLGEHPDSAALVRARLDRLGRLGLIGEPPADARPDRVGDYEVIDVLGRGGMGVVYEARQDHPRRRVALKVLRSMPGADGLQRFRREAEVLGRLQHPGIAQVYEASTATVGGMTVPFFAMELVRGRSIDRYAAEEGLGLRQRLALLARVADAVHHAHQKGVVHRDLKPANILVDERGQPRVLDFGVACSVDPDLELETARTEAGQLVGTLAHMSPEQAAGTPREVDSRTDVYALGVLAYQLLAGRLPHEPDGRGTLEVLRSIQEDEPPRLSRLDRRLRGDVETIVHKALAKEKDRRYPSAHELAQDLRRYLGHQPITARPATALYQLATFARRHRALVGGAAALVVTLCLGLAGTARGMLEAARERDDAERRFREADAVLDFLKRMFASADPDHEGVQVEDMLDRGQLLLEERTDPVERAALGLMLGEAYESVGLYEKAEPLLAGAVTTFERDLGGDDLQTLAARTALGELYVGHLARLDAGEEVLEGLEGASAAAHGRAHEVTLRARLARTRLAFERGRYRESADIAREVLDLAGDHRRLWADAMHRLARALERLADREQALAVAARLYDWSRETYGEQHPATWSALTTYGNMLRDAGRVAEGAALLERLVELRTVHLGPQHPDTINAQANLAISCVQSGELDRAQELLERVLVVCEERYPRDHPERLFALNTLASVHMLRGNLAKAVPLLREVVTLASEVLGPDHLDTTASMGNLARALAFSGHGDEAEALFAEVLDRRRATAGEEHVDTLRTMVMYGEFLSRAGRLDEADLLLGEAVEIGRRVLGNEDYVQALALRCWGDNLLALGNFEQAEAALQESHELGARIRPGHPDTLGSLRSLENLYRRWGRPERAAEVRAQLEASDPADG